MSRLDEAAAAATSGEMCDPGAIGYAWCFLILACEWVRDYERAAQWCARFEAFCARWRTGAFLSVCRTHYAAVLIWHGAWTTAEAQLASAINAVATMRPPMAGDGLVRLGELRRRQGRWDEAEMLFSQAEGHPAAWLGRAALALDRGHWAEAADLADRFLRQLGAAGRVERAAGLELLVRARAGLGDVEGAGRALTELQAIAAAVGTEPLRASDRVAEGALAAAAGDAETARWRFEDALDCFTRCGAPFDAALTRVELARCLETLGRRAAAERELTAAIETLDRIGAIGWVERVRTLAQTLHASDAAVSDPAGLSPRELEVVSLIAQGRSNAEIAATLVISLRTVERHVSTIYEKLGAHGRGARALATAYALRHGLTTGYV
jgi:DNA-binding CsgD family transcriptional regulator